VRPVEERNQALYLGLLDFRGTNIRGRQTSIAPVRFPNDFVETTCHIDLIKYDGVDFLSNGDTESSFAMDHNTVNQFTVDEVLITNGSRLESNTSLFRSDEIKRVRTLNSTVLSRDTFGLTYQVTAGELFEVNGCILDITGTGFQTPISVDAAKVLNTEFVGITDRPWDFTGSTELQVNAINSPITQALTFDLNPAKYYAHKIVDNVIGYSNTAPVAGTWTRGDRLYHLLASASSTEGFICVSSGTPGTWKTMGVTGA